MSATATAEVGHAAAWYDGEGPEVSVIILNYNKPDLTRLCLEHLWTHTTGHRYEIIVVDNGSAPENVAPLREVTGPFRLLRLEVNRYFGEGNNIGAEAARGDYVLFLNNDAFVTEGWLEPLVRRLASEPLLGGVGPRFLYPDGRVQEAGAFLGADGGAVQVGKFGAYAPDDVEEDHVVDYCSAACFLMRRDFFLAIGGFEYVYEPAYYEDADLCLKIAARGRFVGYCAASRVNHIENATSSTHRAQLGLHNIIDVNRVQFLKLWGERLRERERGMGLLGTLPPAPPRPAGRPRAVLYTPYDITPGGGERYLLTAATSLLQDFDVCLATEEVYSHTRLRAIGRDLDLDLHGLQRAKRADLARIGPFDLSVVMANEALPPFAPFAPRNLYICQFPFPQHWADNLRRTGNLDGFAGTVVYSDFVRNHLLRVREELDVARHPVHVIAPPVPLAPAGTRPTPLAPPYRLVLVGRFFAGGHNKRHDVAIEAVRRLVALGLPVHLDLVGSLAPQAVHRDHYTRLVALAHGLPVSFHPNATPASLASILGRGHVYVHAAGYGVNPEVSPHECEHFGISVLEAMSYGLVPFVVANGGPPGFVRDGRTGYTYTDLDGLVSGIAAALSAPASFSAIREAAAATAETFAERAFAEAWRARAASVMA